jgi:DNA-binding MarR family transcriptional regulator
MELLPSAIRVLMPLTKPKAFSEVVRESGLSVSAVAKWLRILEAQGLVKREHGIYKITDSGKRYLRSAMTSIVNLALDKGLVDELTLYVLPAEARAEVTEDGVRIAFKAHSTSDEGTPARVYLDLGDDLQAIEELCKRIKKPGQQ